MSRLPTHDHARARPDGVLRCLGLAPAEGKGHDSTDRQCLEESPDGQDKDAEGRTFPPQESRWWLSDRRLGELVDTPEDLESDQPHDPAGSAQPKPEPQVPKGPCRSQPDAPAQDGTSKARKSSRPLHQRHSRRGNRQRQRPARSGPTLWPHDQQLDRDKQECLNTKVVQRLNLRSFRPTGEGRRDPEQWGPGRGPARRTFPMASRTSDSQTRTRATTPASSRGPTPSGPKTHSRRKPGLQEPLPKACPVAS